MKNSMFIDLRNEFEKDIGFAVSYGNKLDKNQKNILVELINKNSYS